MTPLCGKMGVFYTFGVRSESGVDYTYGVKLIPGNFEGKVHGIV